MKAKFIFAACLLFSMALVQVTAQNGKNGNGSVAYKIDMPSLYQVVINGVPVDYITGYLTYHIVDHYVNGEWVAQSAVTHGVLTGELTGKTYRISALSKPIDGQLTYWSGDNPWTTDVVEDGVWLLDPAGYALEHLICEDGTVYIMRYKWSLIDLLNGGNGMTDYEIRVAGKK